MQPLFLFYFGGNMFKPHYIFDKITDISVDFFKEKKIKGLLLDIDNTISQGHKNKTLREGFSEWLSAVKQSGIDVIILSNAKTNRAQEFAATIGLDAVGFAAKPLPFAYFRAVKKLGLERKEVAVIGDQIFTDILGGRLSGVKTILVTDIMPENSFGFKIKRFFERIMLKRWKK